MPTGNKKELDEIKSLIEAHIVETEDQANRMDLLDRKIEKLTDAVVAIARAEEKISILIDTVKDINKKVDESEDKIYDLEKNNIAIEKTLSITNKFFWITVAAVITAVATAIIL